MFSTSDVAAFLKLKLTVSLDKPGSMVISTSLAAASERNTSVAVVSCSSNDTIGGSDALFSLGNGVTRKTLPSRLHEHSALSHNAFSALLSFTLVRAMVTGLRLPEPTCT